MALDIFALIVMFVIAAVAIWLVVILGSLPGKVTDVVEISASSQIQASGTLPSDWAGAPPDRWAVRATLDDADLAEDLPQGTAGSMTVFTNGGKAVHVISKVVMRKNAWMAFLTNP